MDRPEVADGGRDPRFEDYWTDGEGRRLRVIAGRGWGVISMPDREYAWDDDRADGGSLP